MEPYKDFEIWLGYHPQMGGSIGKPEKLGVVNARTFENACYKYELQNKLKWAGIFEAQGKKLEMEWSYDHTTNSCTWNGKYYSSESEALSTFL